VVPRRRGSPAVADSPTLSCLVRRLSALSAVVCASAIRRLRVVCLVRRLYAPSVCASFALSAGSRPQPASTSSTGRRPRVRSLPPVSRPFASTVVHRPPRPSGAVRASVAHRRCRGRLRAAFCASATVFWLARRPSATPGTPPVSRLSARPQLRFLAPQGRPAFSVVVRDVCHVCVLLLRRLAVRATICDYFFASRSVGFVYASYLQLALICSDVSTVHQLQPGFLYHRASLSQICYTSVLFLLFNMTSNAIVVNIVLDGQNYPE
jgi:hypothetical protein